MKKLLLILALLSTVIMTNGQDSIQKTKVKKGIPKELPAPIKNFGFGVDVFYNLLAVKPLDINGNPMKDGVNRGVNVYGLYRFKVKFEPMRIYVGLGISCQNFYFKSVYGNVTNSSGQNIASFIPINNGGPEESKINYRYSKLAANYLYIPIGVYFKLNNGFNISLGVEGGLNIDNHTKYIGDDIYVENGVVKKVKDGSTVNIKRKDIRNVNTWRFNGTFRIGYKWINAFCSYQLNPTFKQNLGPKINPISLGITIQPF